jgi:nucleotide-binding universal stress UspA family protein
MYRRILVALDHTKADESLLPHVVRLSEESQCDLIAMTTHGHRLIGDILFGSTINYVRHRSKAPLLIVSPKG